jgi:hypothetical protein
MSYLLTEGRRLIVDVEEKIADLTCSSTIIMQERSASAKTGSLSVAFRSSLAFALVLPDGLMRKVLAWTTSAFTLTNVEERAAQQDNFKVCIATAFDHNNLHDASRSRSLTWRKYEPQQPSIDSSR